VAGYSFPEPSVFGGSKTAGFELGKAKTCGRVRGEVFGGLLGGTSNGSFTDAQGLSDLFPGLAGTRKEAILVEPTTTSPHADSRKLTIPH